MMQIKIQYIKHGNEVESKIINLEEFTEDDQREILDQLFKQNLPKKRMTFEEYRNYTFK